MKNRWVPFPEVTEATGGNIEVGPSAIQVDDERLLLNTKAVGAGLITIGGYESVVMGGTRRGGNIDHPEVQPSGMPGLGTPAGVTHSEAASNFSNSRSDPAKNVLDLRNGTSDLRWNADKLDTDIKEQSERVNVRRRARQLDEWLRYAAIADVGYHNTIGKVRDIRTAGGSFVAAASPVLDLLYYGGICTSLMLDSTEVALLIASVASVNKGMSLIPTYVASKVSESSACPDPLFFSVRITRAVVSTAFLQQRLVKAKS